MEYKNIIFNNEAGIGLLTFNRPQVLNALNFELLKELDTLLDLIIQDKSIRVLILTGSGEKSFVAGADINEITDFNPITGRASAENGQRILNKIENLNIPVIAAINGFALGAGAEIALACHIRIASEKAKIGLPEVSLGIIPGYGGTQRLPRIVGKGIAIEMITTGKMLDAKRAYEIGLVNQVVAPEKLLEAAKEMAQNIMKNGPVAISMALNAVNFGLETTLSEGQKHEAALLGLTCSTDDKIEGARAFVEKRKANFTGR